MVKRPPWQCPGRRLRLLRARLASLGCSTLPGSKGRATGRPATASAARASRLEHRRFHRVRLTAQEDKRLRQEAQAAQRQEEVRSRRQAARQEISAAYREVVIEQSAAEAAEANEANEANEAAEVEAVPPPTPPAEPTESHSEAVARMMRERHVAREQMQREVAELQGRAAARRAAAALSGGAAAAPRAAPVYDRSLFQRPLLPAEPVVPAAAAGTAGAAAVGAGKSAPARDAWAWAQQREAPGVSGEAVAMDAVSE